MTLSSPLPPLSDKSKRDWAKLSAKSPTFMALARRCYPNDVDLDDEALALKVLEEHQEGGDMLYLDLMSPAASAGAEEG